jgi:hypothetical protein
MSAVFGMLMMRQSTSDSKDCGGQRTDVEGQSRKSLRPNCYLMNYLIRSDDIVVSVEHPKVKLGGLPE